MFNNRYWCGVTIVSFYLIIFQCSVKADDEYVQCPATATISGVEPNQIAGEWHAIHAVLLENIAGIPKETKVIDSPKCRAMKIGSLNDGKMSLTSRFMTSNSSDRTVKEDFNGHYVIHKIGDNFQADVFTKTAVNGTVYIEEENPDIFTYVFSVVPDKYLVYIQCHMWEKEKKHVSGAAIFSRRSSNFHPVISEEEKTAIVEEIKEKTGGKIKIQLFFHTEDCFGQDKEYFAQENLSEM